MKKILVSLLLLTALATQAAPVAPEHDAIRYVGRFSVDYRFDWTGCMIETDFTGSTIQAELDLVDGSAAGMTVVVDGVPRFLKISSAKKTYLLAEDLEIGKKHRIVLFKRSEGAKGTVQFGGFHTSEDGTLSRPEAPSRKMLVIGDSITCGYGNEAKTMKEGNTVENENGYMSYAPIAARTLNADLMMFCWSGRGMYRNYHLNNDQASTIPKMFNQTLAMDKNSEWDHSNYIPDIIVIHLGTNDNSTHGGKEPLPKEGYIDTYKQFITRLRTDAPKSKIVISIGPMQAGPISNWLSEIAASFDNVSTLTYSPFEGEDDKGGHYHPSVKKNIKMATRLVEAIHVLTQ
jgi:hypothetical protein